MEKTIVLWSLVTIQISNMLLILKFLKNRTYRELFRKKRKRINPITVRIFVGTLPKRSLDSYVLPTIWHMWRVCAGKIGSTIINSKDSIFQKLNKSLGLVIFLASLSLKGKVKLDSKGLSKNFSNGLWKLGI